MSKQLHGFIKTLPNNAIQSIIDAHTDLLDSIPQYMISYYLEIKPQSFSRIKKHLNKEYNGCI